ncbi:peptidoglycan-binding domain-containing protein [Streptomyces sp. NBC_01546]|uniref:peptidoglycan-binding domain-containing protein n=1 Tax=Streptomyces sp. NBC_01546 TaxID=2975872 RepID=UPI002F907BCB
MPSKAPHQHSSTPSAAPAGKPKSRNSARAYVIAAVTAALVFGGAAGLIATTADPGDKEAKNPGQNTSAEPPAAPEAEPPNGKNNATSSGRPSTAPKGTPSSSKSGSTAATPGASRPSGTTPASTTGAAGAANCKFNWDRTQTMAKGMVGSKVKQIQCLLNSNYGQSLTVDGNFGADTEAAVKTVQACTGLTADGQVGMATWSYLDHPKAACGH